jgi:predicted dehydrogenase
VMANASLGVHQDGAMETPVRVGLVGTGPWAHAVTAPLLAEGPDCVLSGIWGRRFDAAETLAHRHGTTAAASLDELIDGCGAVMFSVPPDVQAELALRAVAAGRPVLLDKPIGMTLDEATALADAIEAAGVVSQVVLTNRYKPAMRQFLTDAAMFRADGARAVHVHGNARPGEYFGTPLRLAEGSLLDLGPHVFDALDGALGTIVDVRAAGDPCGVLVATCIHESGAVSSAVMSGTTPGEPSGLVVELYGPSGRCGVDFASMAPSQAEEETKAAHSAITREFAHAVRTGIPHLLDARRGVYLQRLIDMAARSLR